MRKKARVVGFLLTPLFLVASLGFLYLLRPQKAQALTTNGLVTVTAEQAPTCTAGNASVAFGAYNSTTGNTASGSLTVTCNVGISANVELDAGTNVNNAVAGKGSRAMNNGAATPAFLGYDLFYDTTDQTNFTNPWSQTNFVTVEFGNASGETALNGTTGDLHVSNWAIGGAATPVAAAGTAGVTFAQGANVTSNGTNPPTGATPGTLSGGNQPVTLTVYGSVPSTQTVSNGAFVDFVGVIVSY